MKKSVKVLTVIVLAAIASVEAKACYVGPNVRCCHPMLGCDGNTASFNAKLNALLVSAQTQDDEDEVLKEVTLETINPPSGAPSPSPTPVYHNPSNPEPCGYFHIHCDS